MKRFRNRFHAISLQSDERIYQTTEGNAQHRAANIGIANTPFIFNIALGYMFAF